MALTHIHFNASVKSRKTHSNGKTTNAVGSSAYRYKNAFTSHLGVKYDYSHRQNEFVEGFLMINQNIQKAIFNNPTKNPFARAFSQIKQDKTLKTQEKQAEASNHLWNLVEATEKRKDAQLFREIELSLYHNLSYEENRRILRKFIKENFTSKGMIADVCIHDSGGKGSNKNLHAHIMLTMRDFDCENVCFGKKNRTWNDLSLVEQWRKNWTEISNQALTKANQNTVEHKSFQRLAEQAAREGKFDLADAYIELERNKAVHISSAKKTEAQARKLQIKRAEKLLPTKKTNNLPKEIETVRHKLALINETRLYAGNYYKNKEKIIARRQKLAEKREKIYQQIKEMTQYVNDTVTKFINGISRRNAERTKQRRQNLSSNLRRIAQRSPVPDERTTEITQNLPYPTIQQSEFEREIEKNFQRFKPK